MILFLATTNIGKINDIKDYLKDRPDIKIDSLLNYEAPESPESYDCIEANAIQKYVFYRKWLQSQNYPNCIIMTEDSGLFINSLNGEPGANTARFSGSHDADKTNEKILEVMKDVSEDRIASFASTISFGKLYDNRIRTVTKSLAGMIAYEISKTPGFAFNTIFCPGVTGITLSEMPESDRIKILPRTHLIKRYLLHYLEFQIR